MSELRSPKAARVPQASAPKSSAVTLCSARTRTGPTPSSASPPIRGASNNQELGSRPAAAMAAPRLPPAGPMPRLTAAGKHRAANRERESAQPQRWYRLSPASRALSPRAIPLTLGRPPSQVEDRPPAHFRPARFPTVSRGGGGAGRAELTGVPGGGGQGGVPSLTVRATGLMAEVSWKVLERRARAKRSGLAGWGATPFPRAMGGPPFQAPWAGGRWGSWNEPCTREFPLRKTEVELAFHLMSPLVL